MALYAIDILNARLVGVCGENTDKGAWEKVVLAGVIGSMVSAETGCQVAKDLKQAVAKTSFAADEVLLAAIVPVVVDAKAGKAVSRPMTALPASASWPRPCTSTCALPTWASMKTTSPTWPKPTWAKKRPKPSGKKPLLWKPHLIRENSLIFDERLSGLRG